jgi:hypothetical protein
MRDYEWSRGYPGEEWEMGGENRCVLTGKFVRMYLPYPYWQPAENTCQCRQQKLNDNVK